MSARAGTTDLVLENELLTNEVRRLRGRVAELEERLLRMESANRSDDFEEPRPRRRALERQALDDLRYLIARANATPLAPLLRTRKGYRNLERRYGVS